MFREKMKRIAETKSIAFGTHVFCGTPMLTEAIASCGFDAVWIDMEHTAIDKAAVLDNLIAIKAGSKGETAAFVRIPWNDMVLAKPIIDMGPDAIIFPYVRNAEEAKNAVASCEYPPAGIRGYGPLRALGYGSDTPLNYVKNTCREMLRIIQVEHIDCVNCLEEILKIDGIDGFIVGPNDLSGSLGHIGEYRHPDMDPVYDHIGDILRGTGKLFGVSLGFEPEFICQWIDRGVNIVFTGHDVGYVYEGAIRIKKGLNEITKSHINR